MKYFFIIALTLVAACTSTTSQAQKSNVKTVSVKKFERKMQRPNVIVLDVRTAEEFSQGHIENAVLLDVNQSNFTDSIKKLDKRKTYLVYCRSGKRSEKALDILSDNGFQKAYHLKGGYLEWQKRNQ